ncbi:MAG: hypothetical protein AB7E47_02190 [Desulfovibrionaceae bacterium]
MPAYNFKKQFAQAVESGEKRQTIRAIGKRRHAWPGERLQLYTGMRTKACRKLVTPDPVCKDVVHIVMNKFNGQRELEFGNSPCLVFLFADGTYRNATADEQEEIAHADGFASFDEMYEWFEQAHGMPFRGVMVRW